MLLKNCIYFILIVISLLSIPILIYSIKNKNKNNSKSIKIIIIFYIIYLILGAVVIPDILCLDIGLEFLLIEFVVLIAIIIYLISTIICSKKIKKSNEIFSLSKKTIVFTLLLIILPILLFLGSFIKEYYLIMNSDLVLVYNSSGNGGFGNSTEFAYAINEKYCEEISLGIGNGDYSLVEYLPKKAKKIDNIKDISNLGNYDIHFDSNDKYISVYKNGKLIHKEQLNSSYFNIDFDGGFYINNN